MINKTLQECSNASVSLDDMTEKQVSFFENNLIKYFKLVEWSK